MYSESKLDKLINKYIDTQFEFSKKKRDMVHDHVVYWTVKGIPILEFNEITKVLFVDYNFLDSLKNMFSLKYTEAKTKFHKWVVKNYNIADIWDIVAAYGFNEEYYD
jgi:hypothetical protein